MPARSAQPSPDATHESAFLALLRTCSVLTNDTERFLRTHGLSVATYQLIRSLRDAGAAGKTSTQLGEDMVSRVPDVTRLVDRMQKAGYVERSRDRSDGRVVRVAITRKGLALLDRIQPALTRLRQQQLGGLSATDLAELTRMLRLVREHAHQHAAGTTLAAPTPASADGTLNHTLPDRLSTDHQAPASAAPRQPRRRPGSPPDQSRE